MRSPIILILLAALGFPFLCLAAIDIHKFDTESQRQRYFTLVDELRCPKCQNQNLSGSNSQIAQDLRRELHRLLLEGKTDREIKAFMVDRYGDFVLYKPPLSAATLFLWLFPGFLIAMGVWILLSIVRYQKGLRAAKTVGNNQLSDKEQSDLTQILNGQSGTEMSARAEKEEESNT